MTGALAQQLTIRDTAKLQKGARYEGRVADLLRSLRSAKFHTAQDLILHDAFSFHEEQLIQRKDVSRELASADIPVRKLAAAEGEKVLDMVRVVVTVRYRELYGTTRGDPTQVVEVRPGRRVSIYSGPPPRGVSRKRLPRRPDGEERDSNWLYRGYRALRRTAALSLDAKLVRHKHPLPRAVHDLAQRVPSAPTQLLVGTGWIRY